MIPTTTARGRRGKVAVTLLPQYNTSLSTKPFYSQLYPYKRPTPFQSTIAMTRKQTERQRKEQDRERKRNARSAAVQLAWESIQKKARVFARQGFLGEPEYGKEDKRGRRCIIVRKHHLQRALQWFRTSGSRAIRKNKRDWNDDWLPYINKRMQAYEDISDRASNDSTPNPSSSSAVPKEISVRSRLLETMDRLFHAIWTASGHQYLVDRRIAIVVRAMNKLAEEGIEKGGFEEIFDRDRSWTLVKPFIETLSSCDSQSYDVLLKSLLTHGPHYPFAAFIGLKTRLLEGRQITAKSLKKKIDGLFDYAGQYRYGFEFNVATVHPLPLEMPAWMADIAKDMRLMAEGDDQPAKTWTEFFHLYYNENE
jgi:hypothetical protein